MSVAVILVAAGLGQRLGAGKPKALVHVAGLTLLEHSVARSVGTYELSQIVITCPAGYEAEYSNLLSPLVPDSISLAIVPGGETRQLSIALALTQVTEDADVVLVHDAARSFTPTEVFDRVVAEVRATGFGVVPVIAVHDTVKRTDGGEVLETLDRSQLRAAQTPQGFPTELLKNAYAAITKDHTDDASLVQSVGHRVLSVAGDRMAMKITTQDDLLMAGHLIGGEQRTGIGTDTHRFSEDESKPLFLGTILWEGERGLDGHSDGDALSHAIVDALLSAAGLGDIGSNFGVDRPEFSGANGRVFLVETLNLLEKANFAIINVSAQIIGNRPKVAPMREKVEQALTGILNAPVTISATTTDGLGFLGNSEGVAVVASALLQRKDK